MTTKTKSRKKTSKIGSGIIRGWFDTVINPLLQALRWEQARLEKKYWTWQVPPGKLESIRPIKNMIPHLAEDNLEQFAGFYPVLKADLEFHDEEVIHLAEKCCILQKAIEKSGKLKEIYQQANSDDSLTPQGKPVRNVFSSYSETEHLELLAQYVVNRTGELPHHYTYSPVWNKYKDELLTILDLPEIKQKTGSVDDHGEKLLKVVQRLIEELKKTREELSLEHDVPLVTNATIYGE